jgi:hypothetical protein
MDNNNVPYPEALEKVLQGPPERTAVLHSVPEDLAELVRHNRYRDAAHIARIIANTAGGVEGTSKNIIPFAITTNTNILTVTRGWPQMASCVWGRRYSGLYLENT